MKSGRFVIRLAAILFVLAIATESAAAQTAHFSGVVRPLVTGYSPSGVAVDLFGNVYIADSGAGAVHELVAVNGQVSASSTVITVSGFNKPTGIAVDSSGDVFVADTGNNAAKEIVATSGQISSSSSVVPVGSGFSAPAGVAVDSSGNVFVADAGHNAVKEIVAVNGVVSGTSAVNPIGSGFSSPSSVVVDGGEDLFITDKNGIEEVMPVPYVSISVASTVLALGKGIRGPSGIAVDLRGNLFVGDTDNQAVDQIQLGVVDFGKVDVGKTGGTILIPFIFDSAGTLSNWEVLTQGAANFEFKEAASGTTCSKGTTYAKGDTCSIAVAFSPQHPGLHLGAVLLPDWLLDYYSSLSGRTECKLAGTGVGPLAIFARSIPWDDGSQNYLPGSQRGVGGFWLVGSLVADVSGDIFVADPRQKKVQEIVAVNGRIPASPTIKTLGDMFHFFSPQAVAVDGAGNVFVADAGPSINEIKANGGYDVLGLPGWNSLDAVAVDGVGNVFVTGLELKSGEWQHGPIYEILAAGRYTTTKKLATGFQPNSLALDGSGNLYFSDGASGAVKEILAEGGYTTVKTLLKSGIGGSLSLDPAGNLYGTSDGHAAVALAEGGYTTVRTLNAQNQAWPVIGAVPDGKGNIFVFDYYHGSPTELDYADPPSLSFGWTPPGVEKSGSIAVINTGNADLNIPPPGSGTNPTLPSGFTLDTKTTCPQVTAGSSDGVLAQGTDCTYAIDFIPPAWGTYSGSLSLTDNNLNAPGTTQEFPLSGEGLVPPTAGSVTPSAGHGMTQQFSFVGSSLNAVSYLTNFNMLFNSTSTRVNSCNLIYFLASNLMRLMSDDGNSWTWGNPGASKTLSNSQCSVDLATTTVSFNGNSLTVSPNITFSTSFIGGVKILMNLANVANMTSGWKQVGTWTVGTSPNVPPTADSVTPSSGYGMTKQFSFVGTSPSGVRNLDVFSMLFNNASTPVNGCNLFYYAAANQMRLLSDDGKTWTSGNPGAAGKLSNSQCSVDLATTTATPNGNSLAVAPNIAFSASFTGGKKIFLNLVDTYGMNDWKQVGTWMVGTSPDIPPTADSVTPSSGHGMTQQFTFVGSSPNGVRNLDVFSMLFTSTSTRVNGCNLFYFAAANQMRLMSDDGKTWTSGTLGTSATLNNSQCSVDLATSTATRGSNSLTVAPNLTFSAGFTGGIKVFLNVADVAGMTSGGWRKLGTWTVGP